VDAVRQWYRELICYVPVSKDNRVSEHSAAGGAVSFNQGLR